MWCATSCKNTLGRLLEEGADPHALRILDPACGSGSFLIEAFDVLDRWLARHGTEEDKQFPRRRRLRILQENLYGVDLDEQAVEVARLNLLLRAAGERERLPMLTHIRRGNSLIDDPCRRGRRGVQMGGGIPGGLSVANAPVVAGDVWTHNARLGADGRSRRQARRAADFLPGRSAPDRREDCGSLPHAPHRRRCVQRLPDHVHMVLAAETERC
ncbi:MAG: N-6 DNA methylase [Anaerolineae bacterium]|nr:N-6 DNA methylase [Anaerolineae bacterium]